MDDWSKLTKLVDESSISNDGPGYLGLETIHARGQSRDHAEADGLLVSHALQVLRP